jgi:hypothetical protein
VTKENEVIKETLEADVPIVALEVLEIKEIVVLMDFLEHLVL